MRSCAKTYQQQVAFVRSRAVSSEQLPSHSLLRPSPRTGCYNPSSPRRRYGRRHASASPEGRFAALHAPLCCFQLALWHAALQNLTVLQGHRLSARPPSSHQVCAAGRATAHASSVGEAYRVDPQCQQPLGAAPGKLERWLVTCSGCQHAQRGGCRRQPKAERSLRHTSAHRSQGIT